MQALNHGHQPLWARARPVRAVHLPRTVHAPRLSRRRAVVPCGKDAHETHLMRQVSDLQARLAVCKAQLQRQQRAGALMITNTAAQLLLAILRPETSAGGSSADIFRHSHSTWAQRAPPATLSKLTAHLPGAQFPDTNAAANALDSLITARNDEVHPCSTAALDARVHYARTLLRSCPNLYRDTNDHKLHLAVTVLDAYEELKAAFPAQLT